MKIRTVKFDVIASTFQMLFFRHKNMFYVSVCLCVLFAFLQGKFFFYLLNIFVENWIAELIIKHDFFSVRVVPIEIYVFFSD